MNEIKTYQIEGVKAALGSELDHDVLTDVPLSDEQEQSNIIIIMWQSLDEGR